MSTFVVEKADSAASDCYSSFKDTHTLHHVKLDHSQISA